MFDDMISTAGSITGAAKTLHEHGVKEIHVGGNARGALRPGDRAAQGGEPRQPGRHRLDPAPRRADSAANAACSPSPRFLGEAIKRIHRNESVSRLFPVGKELRLWQLLLRGDLRFLAHLIPSQTSHAETKIDSRSVIARPQLLMREISMRWDFFVGLSLERDTRD